MNHELGQGHLLAEGHDPKNCATCRREAQLDGMSAHTYDHHPRFGDESWRNSLKKAAPYLDRLLAHFEDSGNLTERAIAEAIKYGMTEHISDNGIYYRINYPTKEAE